MKRLDEVLTNQKDVLGYLKSRFPIYHLSNVFFRDIQYGIRMYFKEKGVKLGYTEAEKIARRYVEEMERAKIFKPVDKQSWVVDYPEFRTPPVKPAPAAKPAAAPSRAASPPASAPLKEPPAPATGETPGGGQTETR